MQFNLKVKVLKKSKDAPYPEHIIVERKSTNEMAHLYFDDGVLKRLTHIARDPQITVAWDEKEKKYNALLPNYLVVQDIVFQQDNECHPQKSSYLKGPQNQKFFSFSVGPIWNQSCIGFRSHSDSLADFFIEMDLNDKCVPNAYLHDYGVAEIKEVYPHQKRKIHPLSKFIANGKIKLR